MRDVSVAAPAIGATPALNPAGGASARGPMVRVLVASLLTLGLVLAGCETPTFGRGIVARTRRMSPSLLSGCWTEML